MSSYATPQDLYLLAMPQQGLPPFQTATVQQLHLDAASDLIDNYLGDQVTLPLKSPIPLSIKMKVCQIAAWTLLTARGYNPQNPNDENMRLAFEAAEDWLKAISKGEIKPPALTDSSPSGIPDGGPDVLQVTSPQVGSVSPGFPGSQRSGSCGGGFVIGPTRLRGF